MDDVPVQSGEGTDREADREDNGNAARKALKRKARAEQRAEWKAQKAKKKRGGHRHKGPPIAPLVAPKDHVDPGSEADVKAARAARKIAELEDFRTRSAKGTTVVLDLVTFFLG